jgi:acyl-CoA thioester hydrolase
MAEHPFLHYVHEFRVAYHQTDGQRRVHHSNYLNYFEDARVEMLRTGGVRYRDLEDSGRLLVVTEMNVRYLAAAQFDDWLRMEVTLTDLRKVRLSHRYLIRHEQTTIVEAESTIACVGPDGRPKRLPDLLLEFASRFRR